MRVVRWILVALVVLVAALALVLLAARFGDGPLGPLPGGPLRSGELAAAPPEDWGFARDIQEIELQLDAQNTSRITWILVRDGVAYIPCSLDFPPLKSWYRKAAEDGRAIVRVEGKRYLVTLVKVDDATTETALREIAGAKYATGPRPPEGRVWFFRLAARS
jgi:hypothetical protein